MPTTYFPSKDEFEKTVEEKFQQVVSERLPSLVRAATEKKYLTISETCDLLDVSRRHLQYLRDSGQIGFVKHNKKIYFRREDLEKFFSENYIPALDEEAQK